MTVYVRTAVRVVCLIVVMSILSPAQASAGNAVTRWIERALQTVRDVNIGTPNAGRLYAMVGVAIYDAVNGIDTADGDTRAHALVAADGAPAAASREAAAIAAAHAVLSSAVPASYKTAVLDPARDAELAALGASDPLVMAGAGWGASVGTQVVSLRAADGTQAAQNIPAGTAAGKHRASFDSRFRNMTPFGIADKSRYVSDGPPAMTSAEYAEAYEDAKTFGRQDFDVERNEISQFWIAEANTTREPGTWPQAGLAIVEQEGTVNSISDTARLFALMTMAVADAVAVVWDSKAYFFSWRPTVAIREGHADDNPLTTGDPTWTSRSGSIGSSPEYNSGTSSFAGAAAEVVERFYCNQQLAFSFKTDKAPNGPRWYSSVLDAAREAGRSRIYQGIHFQFSNVDGRRVGTLIGREVVTTRLLRAGAVPSCGLQ